MMTPQLRPDSEIYSSKRDDLTGFVHVLKTLELQESDFKALKVLEIGFRCLKVLNFLLNEMEKYQCF